MFFLLVTWATLGMTAGEEASVKSAAIAEIREWTDASGNKRVRAVLLSTEGDKLWLRRPDGKLATTTVSQLSPADRQYVAMHSSTSSDDSDADSTAPGFATRLVAAVGEQVQSMVELPRWTKGSQSETPVRPVPAAVLYVRVSREFLEDYVERTVQRTKPVNDNILGARIAGESDTRGKTTFELLPGKGRLLGKITFEGTVHSQTLGYKSPVVLHQISDSTFRSSKLISLDDDGLHVSPAKTDAPTNLRTTDIDTSLPRLRGRIVRRIAWSRVADSHQQAESITAEHTAAIISRDFDERIDQSVAKVQEVFKSKVPDWDREHQSAKTEVRFRSCPECIEVAMIRGEATTDERKLRPPLVDGNPDVAMRVHRAMLTRAIADPQIRNDWGPAFIKVLNARFNHKQEAGAQDDKKSPIDSTKWAFDLDWLAMDFMDSTR
jgi:SLA1 homology domain 1, SHD1